MENYTLLDSGKGEKLEQIGPYKIIRPSNFAIWPKSNPELWEEVDAKFDRKEGWSFTSEIDERFVSEVDQLQLELFFSKFGHVGIFPEHLQFMNDELGFLPKEGKAMNLFGYTGALSIKLAKMGMEVFHVDASKIANESTKKNMELNELSNVHVFQDDVLKFCKRQLRKEAKFDFILLDPPTHGRGPKAEVFKIEKNLSELISLCSDLVKEKSALLLTCHSPGFTETSLVNILRSYFKDGEITTGELQLSPQDGHPLPSGIYALWKR